MFYETVSVLQDGRVVGWDGGPTLRMHSRPQNCTLGNGQGVDFMRLLPQLNRFKGGVVAWTCTISSPTVVLKYSVSSFG